MPQTLLVTGASAGIGRATAERFLEAGWNVALLARRREALEEISTQWPNALALPTDVTDEPAVARAFAATAEAFGPRILPIDAAAAAGWGRIAATRSVPVIDALLAATARLHGLTLVTRNTADLAGLDVRLLNPFDPPRGRPPA